jgi:probable phosphoglycerate mutase
MDLYLVRHGESFVNLGKTLPKDALDAGLTELGKKQAQALADWLPNHLPQIDVMFTSTMKRALETAAYLEKAYGISAINDDRLREIGNNLLDTSALPSTELPDKYSELATYHFPFTPLVPRIERSETAVHFRARVGLFLDEIIRVHPGQVILAVAHGGVLNAVADAIFNVGFYRRSDIHVPNTAISHFEYRGPSEWETWRVYSIGRIDHLADLDGFV